MTEPTLPRRITVIDSHTEGEPTRVVIDGWPVPPGKSMAERRDHLLAHQDHLRRAAVCEPRGHEAMVGALLTDPVTAGAAAGVIFFNNRGVLGMCGHGLIGVVRTLEFLERLTPGVVRIDTPAGEVSAELHPDGQVTFRNVPALVASRDVTLTVPGLGEVTGDVAYGGNWFFLTELPGESLAIGNLDRLLDVTRRIHATLRAAGIAGPDGEEIDHIELFGPPSRPDADSMNFVLCPGGEYDRSPCGTGTSAKVAVLHARGRLAPGQQWRQESITGGLFTAGLRVEGDCLVPWVRGSAFVTGRNILEFDPADPHRLGFGRH